MLSVTLDWKLLMEKSCDDNQIDKFSTRVLCERLSNEGVSFWITQLPKFSKAVISSIEQGMFVRPSALPEFRFCGKLPLLFRGLLRGLFSVTGVVRLKNPKALKQIRNVCERLSKLAVDYTDETTQQSIDNYAELQRVVSQKNGPNQWSKLVDRYEFLLKGFYGDIMKLTVDDLLSGIPRYGPGSMLLTSYHDDKWDKFNELRKKQSRELVEVERVVLANYRKAVNKSEWHCRVCRPRLSLTVRSKARRDLVGPSPDEATGYIGSEDMTPQLWKRAPIELRSPVLRSLADWTHYFINDGLEPVSDNVVTDAFNDVSARQCQLCLVPKTAKGPRVISKELPEIIYPQMAFLSRLYEELPRLFGGVLNLTDQTRNRNLAREGSDYRYINNVSTIDLSSASDMVSFSLCRQLFRDTGIGYFLENVRATRVRAPEGRSFWSKDQEKCTDTIELGAVGGMGSGLTFPLLTLICHLACCSSIWKYNPKLDFDEIARQVSVYGDDIIVPTKWADHAMSGLIEAGLKPNMDKSFTKGWFRESCGGDYLAGYDVAPIRMKLPGADLPVVSEIRNNATIDTIEGLYQLNKHAAELYSDGQIESAMVLESLLERSGIPMPVVGKYFSGFGRVRSYPYEAMFNHSRVRKQRFIGKRRLVKGTSCGVSVFVSFPRDVITQQITSYRATHKVWLVEAVTDDGNDRYATYAHHALLRNACKGEGDPNQSVYDDLATKLLVKNIKVRDAILPSHAEVIENHKTDGSVIAEAWGSIPLRRSLQIRKRRKTTDELVASFYG